MFVTVIALSPFNSTHYIVLYPQNADRIMTIDSMTSLHPIYKCLCIDTVQKKHASYNGDDGDKQYK